MEAIGHAGTCLGMLASDGILLAAERRITNKLLDEVSYSEKIYKLHEYVYVMPIYVLLYEGCALLDFLNNGLANLHIFVFLENRIKSNYCN